MIKKITQKIEAVLIVAVMVLVTIASVNIVGDSGNSDEKELDVLWQQNFTSIPDTIKEGGNSVEIVHDQNGYISGFIVAGYVEEPSSENYWDMYIIKTDINGNKIWNKSIGEAYIQDVAFCIQQTDDDGDGKQDDGYIIVGEKGFNNLSLVKINEYGNETWNRTFPGPSLGYSVQQTYVNGTYDGYIITGFFNQSDETWKNIWVIKTDENGNEGPQYDGTWNYTYDGPQHLEDIGFSVNQTTNGSYIVAGYLGGMNATGSLYLGVDCCLLEFSSSGSLTHNWTYNWSVYDAGTSVKQALDGDYVLTGFTSNVTSILVWLIKQDPNGGSASITTYPNGTEYIYSLDVCNDGGYVISGTSLDYSVYIIKTYENGTEELSMIYGGTQPLPDYVNTPSIQEISDREYIATGRCGWPPNSTYEDEDVFLMKIIENTRPNPPAINGTWTEGGVGVNYTYTFTSIDPDGDDVSYYIDWDDGSYTDWHAPIPSGETYEASHAWDEPGEYNITAKAKDIYNNESEWSDPFNVTIFGNHQPNPPSINGSEYGRVGYPYNYTFNATDPDGNNVYYTINWDDGNTTGWLGPYNSGENMTCNHTWNEPGGYNITAKAKDIYNNESDWSDPFNVTIEVDYPPNTPTITGPTNGKAGVNYNYTFVTSDPNNDDVYYKINWSDEDITDWLGPYLSDEEVILNHTWNKTGTYTIKAKAKDIYGYESDWGTLTITVQINIFGYTISGTFSQNIYNKISGSKFTILANGTADNITVYIQTNLTSPKTECMIYRVDNSVLIGTTEEKILNTGDEGAWVTFNFSNPKPTLVKDTEYVLVSWSDDTCNFFYDNATSEQSRYRNQNYSTGPVSPIEWTSNESKIYSIFCRYTTKPDITNVSATPNTVGFGFNVTISADINDNGCDIDIVSVNITYPNNITGNFTMNNTGNNTYAYVFNDTWIVGQYNYTIWAVDESGGTNNSSVHNFNVSANATISICTIKDEYGNNETVNLTDPPGDPSLIGYELIDDGKVLRVWNNYDSYYFNTSSGIQLTNHYNEYWSHNVLMLGYYNNDQWHLIYRADELNGFNKNIDTDNETYVNATLWKDLTYLGYDFRLAIKYHLGVDDKELTIIPYIKNLGQAIPYNLGFAWEINDIQVDMTPGGDYLEINGTTCYLNQSLDETYKDMDQPCFYIREDISSDRSESLYLCWNDSLDYLVKVKTWEGQYNAPVTLGIKIGTLAVGQEKYTSLLWHDASEITYYFNSYNAGEAWATNPSYMVDGSTSTYASTNVDGDVDLCNGNNCSGDYLGSISKVELRAYSYYTGDSRDNILRPVFNGTTDGLNYPYQPPSIQPAWSPWLDITSDPFAPESWSWTDVLNLDCDVEAGEGMLGFTLYCSKVEIRVTYTPNNNPVISNPYPADGSTGITIAPLLNITVSDPDGDNMNITWLCNSSGSWQVFGTNNSVSNGTYHQTMNNASTNGKWWYWKVNITDGINYAESSVYKFYTGNQSKIKNTGSINISGYLLIQVQFFDVYNWTWTVAIDNCPNETTPRTILVGEQFGLDTVFNSKINTADLIDDFGTGLYRIYACFRDPYGNVLACDDDSLMEATYEFTINL